LFRTSKVNAVLADTNAVPKLMVLDPELSGVPTGQATVMVAPTPVPVRPTWKGDATLLPDRVRVEFCAPTDLGKKETVSVVLCPGAKVVAPGAPTVNAVLPEPEADRFEMTPAPTFVTVRAAWVPL